MYIDNRKIKNPTFSICIPQYNRTSFLLESLKAMEQQTFKDFEVCISDDCSNDGRENQIIEFLKNSTLSYVYKRQESNLRYDGNTRESIGLANGKYCFLQGNDDCLAAKSTLEDLNKTIEEYNYPEVIITNFEDYESGAVTKRATKTRIIGTGPEVAANQFRNLSFVSGLLLTTVEAQSIATDKWDGLEMYQMYIISRIIASGGSALALNYVTVRKDIQIDNEEVDRYSTVPVVDPCPIIERKVTTNGFGRLVVDAVSDYVPNEKKDSVFFNIFFQLYIFTYSFWVFENRRVQSWKYALGIVLGFRPRNVIGDVKLSFLTSWKLKLIYIFVSIVGLTFPVVIFQYMRPLLYKISRFFFIQN